jgi:transaldolase
MMTENPLITLESFGQSLWMDFIRRDTVTSGELKRLIDQDGISGVTSNPSIFEKAIGGTHDYDDQIRNLARQGKSSDDIYQAITIQDIQMAADVFRPVYNRTHGGDGYVSLEVSPRLAHDTVETMKEAHRLWKSVERPNLMVKVPGTKEGLPAIEQLIAEGLNINITLLFGIPRYQEVAEAYLAGLESLVEHGKAVDKAASVASFFLSRIDVLLDPLFEKKANEGVPTAGLAGQLHGQIAIASAKAAYGLYRDLFYSPRFNRLARLGARTQRLLWASTSTKNPAYSDVKYVEPLVGVDTINTLPIETINAYREHGKPSLQLDQAMVDARRGLKDLGKLGINLDASTQQLEDEGVDKFNKALDQLMAVINQKRAEALMPHTA